MIWFTSPRAHSYMAILSILLIYVLSILLYLQPITRDARLIHNPTPILDEMHLVPEKNSDINIYNSSSSSWLSLLSEVFTNDYWGRPMNSPSSHKSYRPLTILSFRFGHYLSTKIGWNYIFTQRILNIILHAAITQMIGRLSTCLCMNTRNIDTNVQEIVTMVLFMLHPTHVESVVNAANRAHLLGLLFAITSLDLGLHTFITGLIHIAGLLSCETAIFFLPAIILTWVCLDYANVQRCKKDEKYNRDDANGNGDDDHIHCEQWWWKSIKQSVWNVLPRSMLITTISLSYLYIRHALDWISIPDGLIRPAENPFYALRGTERVMNYAFVLSVHLIKSLGLGLVDIVGFSHEYGFDCIEKITNWQDGRLFFPLFFLTLFVFWAMKSIREKGGRGRDSSSGDLFPDMVVYLTFMTWMATLFPVSGVIKVGTFIADRIVIGSTVASCVFWGRIISSFIMGKRLNCNVNVTNVPTSTRNYNRYGLSSTWVKFVKYIIFLQLMCYLWIKIQSRSTEWMYVDTLLESSLRSCPRSAKSHLEISKIHSGLVGGEEFLFKNREHKVNLDVAKYHLELAEEIDPQYCDVHFQVAQLLVLQNKGGLEFEDRLTKGILCPMSMHGAHALFQQYWSKTLGDGGNPSARKRYQKHVGVIQDAIDRENEEKKLSSTSTGTNNHEEEL